MSKIAELKLVNIKLTKRGVALDDNDFNLINFELTYPREGASKLITVKKYESEQEIYFTLFEFLVATLYGGKSLGEWLP